MNKKRRIKASSLQWRGDTYICEELENCEDTMDLLEEYGTRLADGTISADDVVDDDADNFHSFQIEHASEVVKWDD
jgi:hypothetical protein